MVHTWQLSALVYHMSGPGNPINLLQHARFGILLSMFNAFITLAFVLALILMFLGVIFTTVN